MNEQERIARARDYIEQGQYEAAKVVLEELPGNAVAIRLLSEIKIAQEKRRQAKRAKLGQGGGTIPNPTPVVINVPPKKEHEIPRPALFIIVGSMALWSITLIIAAFVVPTSRPIPILGLLAFVFGGCAFLFLLYYLFWKFYWWMLAIFWFLSSLFLVVVFTAWASNGFNMPPT